jgi:transcriptional regulator with XRE-family HTH domain
MADDFKLGRMVKDVRLSRDLRQEDLAARAGVSREAVSRLERGLLDGITVGTLRAISRGLAMPPVVSLGWRAPELERLRDRLHAALVEQVAGVLLAAGWEIAPEHSFNHYGERGAVDVLAWHSLRQALLVVETKTRLWDLQETLVTLDRKRRLLPELAERDRGWHARVLGVVLAMPEMSTHRHVVERHANTFGAALPDRQLELRRWLQRPDRDLRAIWFLPISRQDDIGQRSQRRRATKRSPGPASAGKRASEKPESTCWALPVDLRAAEMSLQPALRVSRRRTSLLNVGMA